MNWKSSSTIEKFPKSPQFMVNSLNITRFRLSSKQGLSFSISNNLILSTENLCHGLIRNKYISNDKIGLIPCPSHENQLIRDLSARQRRGRVLLLLGSSVKKKWQLLSSLSKRNTSWLVHFRSQIYSQRSGSRCRRIKYVRFLDVSRTISWLSLERTRKQTKLFCNLTNT